MKLTPLHARLPQVPPARAQACRALLQRLGGRASEVHALAAPPAGVRWLRCRVGTNADAWLGLAATAAQAPDAQDYLLLAESLAAVEPQLVLFEQALGGELTPMRAEAIPADVCIVQIDAAGLLYLAIDYQAAAKADCSKGSPHLSARLASVSVPLLLRLAGPALPAARIPALKAGDCVLLAPCVHAVLFGAGRALASGRWSPATGQLDIRTLEQSAMQSDSATLPNDPSAGACAGGGDLRWTTLPVSITFELDGATMCVGELAALRPGAVVQLPAKAEAPLRVRMLTAGTPFAEGELVAVGDAYGVRIERLLGS